MKKTYNTYVSISMTKYYDYPQCDYGQSYVSVDSCKLTLAQSLSYKEAKRQLAKIALRMGKLPTREPNPFNPSIVTYTLSGFLD